MTVKEENNILRKVTSTLDIETLLTFLTDEIERCGFLYYRIDLIDDKIENLIIKKVKFPKEYDLTIKNVLGAKIPLNSQEEIMVLCFNRNEIMEINRDNLNRFGETTISRMNYFKINFSLIIPLSIKNDIIGTLAIYSLDSPFKKDFTNLLMEKLTLFFYPLKNALTNQALINEKDENHSLIQRTQKIFEIAETINNLTSIHNVYELLLSELVRLFNFHCGNIYLRNENMLNLVYTYIIDEKYRDRLNQYIDLLDNKTGFDLERKDSTFPIWSYKNNTTIFYHDLSGLVSTDNNTKMIKITNTKTYCCSPIRIKNQPFGVLLLFTFDTPIPDKEIDFKTIEALGNLLGTAIRNAEIYSELEEKNKIISEDLSIAKKIQQNVIFSEHEKIKDLNFYIQYLPQNVIGGDIYDISIKSDKFIRIFLADATGHGIQAALTTMIISNEYQKMKMLYETPDALMTALNNSFLDRYFQLTVFFTCIILDIDLTQNKIIFSSAGQPEQYLISDDEVKKFKTNGKMIGLIKDTKYVSSTLSFSSKDKILLFTDGLFEVFNKNNEEFGENRLFSFIKQNRENDIHSLGKKLYQEISDFTDNKTFDDDQTVIGIEF